MGKFEIIAAQEAQKADQKEMSDQELLLDRLNTALAHHDWWYMMSDDPKYYRAGGSEASTIAGLRAKAKSLGIEAEADALYAKHCPYAREL